MSFEAKRYYVCMYMYILYTNMYMYILYACL